MEGREAEGVRVGNNWEVGGEQSGHEYCILNVFQLPYRVPSVPDWSQTGREFETEFYRAQNKGTEHYT
jgi:hypothetical protein